MNQQISFAWTTAALLAGEKTVTRRDWQPFYAERFCRGMIVEALDQQDRFGGRTLGTIQLVETPHLEPYRDMPDADFAAEGFAFYERHPELLPKKWQREFQAELFAPVPEFSPLRELFDSCRMHTPHTERWVVRFRVIELMSLDEWLELKGKRRVRA